jgi:signal transduction histidine kinase
MAEILAPLFGGRIFSVLFQPPPGGKDEPTEISPKRAPVRRLNAFDPRPANRPGRATAGDSLAVLTALLWLGIFALAEFGFNLPQLVPLMPATDLRLISVPMALFALGLLLRPVSEAPLYCLIYVLASVRPSLGSPDFDFVLARVAVETFQTVAIVCVTVRVFWARLGEPLMIALWATAALAITAAGAGLMIAMQSVVPLSSAALARELGGSDGIAWRTWWLGNACSYLSVGAPAAALITLRHRLKRMLASPGWERHRFVALVAALLVVTLFAFPITDMSSLGLPPGVMLAKRLLPMPFVLALAARFRAYGSAIGILIFSTIAVLSLTGAHASVNWTAVTPPTTPMHVLLLVTAATSMVIAATSRQLKLALNEALEASQMKSRFIAMLNHELRTPLNAILGFSELMRMRQLRQIDDAIGPLANIHASGQRLLAMIEGLLNSADHGASAFELEKQPVELGATIAATVDEMPEFAELGVTISIVVPGQLWIDADPRALKQMLGVLLAYPLRFVGPDARIVILAEHSATDTIIQISSQGLINAAVDDRDKIEVQLVDALALAHGARLTIRHSDRSSRIARLTFFATRAAA